MDSIKLKNSEILYLQDIEDAGISYVPCSLEQPLFKFAHLWGERKKINLDALEISKHDPLLKKMTGIQVFTGLPTFIEAFPQYFNYLLDIDIEVSCKLRYPAIFRQVQNLYMEHLDGNPLITETKSGGLRLSAYAHYSGSKASYTDTQDGKMILEVFATHCMSRYDARYEIAEGSLYDLPTLDMSVFPKIDALLSTVSTRHYQKDRVSLTLKHKALRGDERLSWEEKRLSNNKTIHQSQLLPTSLCKTKHTSNRNEVRFTRYENGDIDGFCFNCGARWWEKKRRTRPVPFQKRYIHRKLNRKLTVS